MPRIFLVDAFSHGPFTGNPAGVCPLDGPADEGWMQNIAMEMNQAETAFFWPEGGAYRLRWFTPGGEVDLCGHATLATAHIVWTNLEVAGPLTFETRSGPLRTSLQGEEIVMDFPSEPAAACSIHLDLPKAVWTGKNRMDLVAVFESGSEVRNFKPNAFAIAEAGGRGLLITGPGDEDGVDFVSRFFAPQLGIPEDPVTGSAHCCLAPLWAERLGRKLLRGYQASRRGGYVGVELRGDRVELRGRAMTMMEGKIVGA